MFQKLEALFRNCKIFFCDVNQAIFTNISSRRYPKEAYYRLLLANFIPDKRVIYLDGDTLILSDLTKMFNLEMNNNYILGFAETVMNYVFKYGIKANKYITSGVLLIDLEKIRNNNITNKFINFEKINRNKLRQNDQTVINIVLYDKIGFLPPMFGLWNYKNKRKVLRYYNLLKRKYGREIYSINTFLNAWKKPTIVHLVYTKPWKNESRYKNKIFHQIWWNITKKYGIYSDVKLLEKKRRGLL